MNNVVEFKKNERARSEAAVWLVRLQEGLQPSQQLQLEAWLEDNALHRELLIELATLWDELEVLTELAPLFEGVPIESLVDDKSSSSSTPSWLSAGLAASLLIVCGVVALSFSVSTSENKTSEMISKLSAEQNNDQAIAPSLTPQSKRYQTPIGEQLEVLLSDGSKATLNTDTHIEVWFTEQRRSIKLLRGEAHFDVFKDPDRPLVVSVSDKAVQAVGTAFSVRKNAGTEIEVAVDEGRVAVYRNTAFNQGKGFDKQATPTASLDAGEVLTIADDQHQLVQYDLEVMADRLAWKQGMIVIGDETLDFVIKEFSRYSERKMLLADRKMGEIRVAGYFRLGDVDALLVALEENFNIRSEYYQKNDTFVLSQL